MYVNEYHQLLPSMTQNKDILVFIYFLITAFSYLLALQIRHIYVIWCKCAFCDRSVKFGIQLENVLSNMFGHRAI